FQLRSADGDAGRLPQLATELVSSQVDVIVATFTPCALAAKQATTSELALKYRLPTASVVRQFAEAGGLLSYGADIRDIYRRSAILVHKILQGTKPSDLPVELPTRFELVLNMKTAKALGIDVPWFFQQRADEVIE